MAIKFLNAVVAGHKHWGGKLHSVMVETPPELNDGEGGPPFVAGQFGRIGLPADDGKEMRPYSFVNAPSARPYEFYYVEVEAGYLTAALPKMPVGEKLLMSPRPAGFLTIEEVPAAETLWMLATGTGVGPFVSILRHGALWDKFKCAAVVHAARFAAELGYRDELREMAENSGGRLRYLPVLSCEARDFALRGRIPALIESGALADKAGRKMTPECSQFMLCGNPQMVKDGGETLKEMGFLRNRRRAPGHITVENYW